MTELRSAKAEIRHARLDAAVDSALSENRIVGAVVLAAQDGEVFYARAAGFADREAEIPMRRDAIFRLASVTKPFVTAAAMRLAERKLIGLDDPVSRWLPDFRPATPDGARPEITLHQLLTHMSGLSYRFAEPADSAYHALDVSDGMDQPGLSLTENLARLARAPLAFTPGSAWRYSLGIDVIGGVLEAAAGKSLAQILQDEIAGPLGLRDTGFSVIERERLVTPYVDARPAPRRMDEDEVLPFPDAGDAVRFSPQRLFHPGSYASGGAGMAGTADGVLSLLEAIRDGGGPILRPETAAEMMRDHAGPEAETQGPGWGFGLGWAVLHDPAAAATPQGKGTLQWGGVYGHSWFVDPENALTLVTLTNTAFEGMNGRFTLDLRDAVYA